MAWRSLFAFDNPNGQVGSTYNATFIPTTFPFNFDVQSGLTTTTNIYTFSFLPIGVYSINLQCSFAVNGLTINYLETGIGTSSTSSVLYPNNYNISTGNTFIYNNPLLLNSTLLLKVTDNNPIYINIVLNANGTFPTSFRILNSTGWSCIATKLA